MKASTGVVRLTDLAQAWISEYLLQGGTVLDATVGNGHDTYFLARTVGPRGRVIGIDIDIQARALSAARKRLKEAGLSDRVFLVRSNHRCIMGLSALEQTAPWRPVPGIGTDGRLLNAAMFNLGYLPGGDKTIRTTTADTLAALYQVRERLAPQGIISVIAYPGHPGGAEERDAVACWFNAQSRERYKIEPARQGNASLSAPILFRLRNCDRSP